MRVDLVANLFSKLTCVRLGCELTWVRADLGANQLG